MPRVRLIADPFDLATYEEVVTDDMLGLLRERFPVWPETGRVYKGVIATTTDVTPRVEEQVEALAAAGEDDLYYVVVYPGDPVTAIVVGAVAVLALAAAFYLLMPKIPAPNSEAVSANNSLGQRGNKARPNERIEDIFGTVTSIPSLLTVPLLTYEDNVQVEVSFMCVGRGSYLIENVRDGSTPLALIAGAGADFYAPGTSPNSGAPQLTVGVAVDAPFRNVYRLNEVNGQKLDPPDHNSVSGSGNIRFVAPNFIQNSGGINFADLFGPGDELTVSGADFGSANAIIDATTQLMRFHSDKRIEFDSFDPSTMFLAGQTITLTNATYAGQHDVSGDVVFIDVSGTYVIDTVDSTTITLV
jgi:hypothetical protein